MSHPTHPSPDNLYTPLYADNEGQPTIENVGKQIHNDNPYLRLLLNADESELIADELFRIGIAYDDRGTMPLKALDYFRKAAERGHAVAQLFMAMGCMKFENDHNDEVMYWLQKAAEQGERQAMYNLGISYHRGDIDGKVDIEKSLYLFRRAAEKGYGAACARLASIYLNGDDGVEQNMAKAKFWALVAYSHGDEEDGAVFKHLVTEADMLGDSINIDKILKEAAEEGEPHAVYMMGNEYIEKYILKAAEYWTKAAESGSLYAKLNLARYYRQVIKDNEKANRLFEEVATQGIEEAQHALAESYYYGLGKEKDVAKAWEWNEKALNMAYTPARYLLAVMCLQQSFDEILPDKVMRGDSYMALAANDRYQPAIDYLTKPQSQTNKNEEFPSQEEMDDGLRTVYNYAYNLIENKNFGYEDVKAALVQDGLPPEIADNVIEHVKSQRKKERSKTCNRQILVGSLLGTAGVVFTLLTNGSRNFLFAAILCFALVVAGIAEKLIKS